MTNNIDYSVIIRTLGRAGEKYQRLLDSISNLVPAPKEIIVVLPEGFEPPKETLGNEIFIYSQKGMVYQRTAGINYTTAAHALICDDDVSFDHDFVQKLYKPIANGICKISAGPLLSFLPQKGIKTFISALSSAAAPILFHKDRYVSVLSSTGYSFNRRIDTLNEKYYKSLSLPGTCFFGEIDALKAISFEDEIWLDKHGYAAYEDQVMFFKAHLIGFTPCVVSNAIYEHADAKTSTVGNKPTVVYSTIFNRIVFWHRFLYTQKKSVWGKMHTWVCFSYRKLWIHLFAFLDILRKRIALKDYKIIKNASKDAYQFIKSSEYLKLPAIRKGQK